MSIKICETCGAKRREDPDMPGEFDPDYENDLDVLRGVIQDNIETIGSIQDEIRIDNALIKDILAVNNINGITHKQFRDKVIGLLESHKLGNPEYFILDTCKECENTKRNCDRISGINMQLFAELEEKDELLGGTEGDINLLQAKLDDCRGELKKTKLSRYKWQKKAVNRLEMIKKNSNN